MSRGKYIVIEGHDGTGKSTQVELLRARLAAKNIQTASFEEPAGTPLSDAVRTIIKNGELPRQPRTNLLLFTAARSELWHYAQQKLATGTWIIASRNYLSTLAYQGAAEGIDADEIIALTEQYTSPEYMHPDATFILATNAQERHTRIEKRDALGAANDTFESTDDIFQMKVEMAYEAIALDMKIPYIDASQTPEEIAVSIWAELTTIFGW